MRTPQKGNVLDGTVLLVHTWPPAVPHGFHTSRNISVHKSATNPPRMIKRLGACAKDASEACDSVSMSGTDLITFTKGLTFSWNGNKTSSIFESILQGRTKILGCENYKMNNRGCPN